jgi:hypothetical protein
MHVSPKKDMKVQAKRIFLLVTAMNHRFVSETGKYEFGVRHKNPIKKRRQLLNKARSNVMSRRSSQQS